MDHTKTFLLFVLALTVMSYFCYKAIKENLKQQEQQKQDIRFDYAEKQMTE
jgi:hypothetical protein